jgi:Transcriptional regulators
MSTSARPPSQRRVYDYLTAEVLIDPSRQGTFLNEQEIAGKVGVSRTPVREALRLLASEGLVEQIPNRGTFIPAVTRKQIFDLMELRILLETHASTVTLNSGSAPVEDMQKVLDAQRRFVEAGDEAGVIQFIALDRDFHFLLLNACNNAEIIQVYDRIQVRQRVIGAKALFSVARWREVISEHQSIVNALKEGSTETASQAIRNHLRRTEGILLADLPG